MFENFKNAGKFQKCWKISKMFQKFLKMFQTFLKISEKFCNKIFCNKILKNSAKLQSFCKNFENRFFCSNFLFKIRKFGEKISHVF